VALLAAAFHEVVHLAHAHAELVLQDPAFPKGGRLLEFGYA
jgi:hypothetical protein